jgi:hypothetical protein
MISPRYVLVTVALMLSLPVYSDSFHVAVQFECRKAADFVAVSYRGAYNDEGEVMMERLGEDGIDPWKLVEVTDDRITRMDTVKRECELSDGLYVVEIGPSPGNGNIQGRCGAQISAWAAFYKGHELLLRTEFESDCFDVESPIRTRVLWRAGAKAPAITEVSYHEFYK